MKHLLSVADLGGADGIEEVLRLTDSFVEVERPRHPQGAGAAGQDRRVAVLRGLDPHPARLRDGGQAAVGRHHELQRRHVVGEEGRVAPRHRETIEAMGVDAIVVRHASAGVPRQVATLARRASVINAGDGWHEHPTQALLDCYTIRQRLGHASTGCRIAIVGDVKHSRVARSDVLAFTALGAEVTLVAPPTLLPPSLEGWPVEVEPRPRRRAAQVDVVYLLRMQRERMTEALVPSLREYTAALRAHRAAGRRLLADKAIVMHPGPMNRGVEIAAEVADLPAAR